MLELVQDNQSYQLIDVINQNECVIYGTGWVANRFYKCLKFKKLDTKIQNFVVSNINECDKSIYGKDIKDLEWLKKNNNKFVLIAVHEIYKDEIINNLNKIGIYKFIWIYPFIFQPDEKICYHPVDDVSVEKILFINRESMRFAIRYLALEERKRLNNIGIKLYLKEQRIYAGESTALKRLERFLNIARDWEEKGYDSKSRVLLTSDFLLMDGNHRVTLARFYNQRFINANVYDEDFSILNLYKADTILSKEKLLMNGFTIDEIHLLEETNKRIFDFRDY